MPEYGVGLDKSGKGEITFTLLEGETPVGEMPANSAAIKANFDLGRLQRGPHLNEEKVKQSALDALTPILEPKVAESLVNAVLSKNLAASVIIEKGKGDIYSVTESNL